MQGNTNSKNHNSKEYKRKQSQIMREVWKRRKEKNNSVDSGSVRIGES